MGRLAFVCVRVAIFSSLAVTQALTDDCTPRQIMLTLGKPASTTMWANWVTYGNCTSKVVVTPSNGSNIVFSSSSAHKYTYSNADYGFYESPFIHHVELTGLSPDSQHSYVVASALRESAATLEYSSTYTFCTPWQTGAGDEPMRVSVIGDLGQTDYSLETMEDVEATIEDEGQDPQFLMIVGDLSYADGNASRWDTWGNMMTPYLTHLPLVGFPGNHEIEIDNRTSETFVNFRERFPMPSDKAAVTAPGTIIDYHAYNFNFTYEYGSSYFSYDVGLVHFVCLNTYVDTSHASDQYKWLEADLSSVDRSETPWVLVFMHGPWYNSNEVHQDEVATEKMFTSMEDLLYENDIAGVWSGHVHAYERTHPVYNNTVNSNGIMYVTIGDGGNREGLYDHWYDDPSPEWYAYRNGSHYGRGDMLVMNSTHLRWQWWPHGHANPEDEAMLINPYSSDSPSHRSQSGSSGLSTGAIAGIATAAAVAVILVIVLASRWCIDQNMMHTNKQYADMSILDDEEDTIWSLPKHAEEA